MASTSASVTLNGASSVGAGTSANFSAARCMVTAVLSPTGTVTSGLVVIEGSHDNSIWVPLHVFSPMTARNESFSTAGVGAYRYFRGNIIGAITGGGTVRVTLMYADSDGGIL